jgi:hypothetical protein
MFATVSAIDPALPFLQSGSLSKESIAFGA